MIGKCLSVTRLGDLSPFGRFFKASGDNISAQFAIEICLGDFGDFAIDIGRLYKACSENILAHFSIEICLW